MDSSENKARELLITGTLEEYRMLRAEIKQRQANMIALITATVAVNGVLLKLGFDLAASAAIGAVILALFFLIIIPSINLILLLVLLFEVAQMMQFGNYVLYHEAKMKGIYPLVNDKSAGQVASSIQDVERKFCLEKSRVSLDQPLAWEQWLRAMKKQSSLLQLFLNMYRTRLSGHLESMYMFRIAIFVLLALLSSGIGIYLCWGKLHWLQWILAISVPYALFLIPSVTMALGIRKSSNYIE